MMAKPPAVRIDAGKAFIVAFGIWVLSFLLAFAVAQTSFSMTLASIWPKFEILVNYCSNTTCIYRPELVASVYLFSIIVPVFVFLLLLTLESRAEQNRKLLLARLLIVVIFTSCSIAMILAPFDFETERRLVHENSVTWSYAGITRAAWPGLALLFFMVAGHMGDKIRQLKGL